MAGESAFDKRHVEASALSDVEGLLEHLNLPPAVIKYIRTHKKKLQIAAALFLVMIVALAVYDSYRGKRIEEAASALAVALQKGPEEKGGALAKVASDFSGTTSALWAGVELAHLDMQTGKFAEAADKYQKIRNDLDKSDPLYALTMFGVAQAREANHDYPEAFATYQEIKNIDGYQVIGYTGMARIQETQGKVDSALETLNEFLTTMADKPATDPGKQFVEEKISRLKARQ
jgi:predicted negative regulator of RcsB-dependent stress response